MVTAKVEMAYYTESVLHAVAAMHGERERKEWFRLSEMSRDVVRRAVLSLDGCGPYEAYDLYLQHRRNYELSDRHQHRHRQAVGEFSLAPDGLLAKRPDLATKLYDLLGQYDEAYCDPPTLLVQDVVVGEVATEPDIELVSESEVTPEPKPDPIPTLKKPRVRRRRKPTADGLRVFDTLNSIGAPVHLKAIAARMNVPTSMVRGALFHLCHVGLVRRDGARYAIVSNSANPTFGVLADGRRRR